MSVARFTITHHGVPVGAVEFDPLEDGVELGVRPVAVRPLIGYTVVHPVVRAASCALADAALAGRTATIDTIALRRGTELGRELELHDTAGALVPTDFIVLTEWPGGNPEIAATLRLRDAHAAVPAVVRPRPLDLRGAEQYLRGDPPPT